VTEQASTYVDAAGATLPRATVLVHEAPRTVRVTYRGADGARFRVLIHQRPNPIGFAVRLPGDIPRTPL